MSKQSAFIFGTSFIGFALPVKWGNQVTKRGQETTCSMSAQKSRAFRNIRDIRVPIKPDRQKCRLYKKAAIAARHVADTKTIEE